MSKNAVLAQKILADLLKVVLHMALSGMKIPIYFALFFFILTLSSCELNRACTLIGCSTGVTLEVSNQRTLPYSFQVSFSGPWKEVERDGDTNDTVLVDSDLTDIVEGTLYCDEDGVLTADGDFSTRSDDERATFFVNGDCAQTNGMEVNSFWFTHRTFGTLPQKLSITLDDDVQNLEETPEPQYPNGEDCGAACFSVRFSAE